MLRRQIGWLIQGYISCFIVHFIPTRAYHIAATTAPCIYIFYQFSSIFFDIVTTDRSHALFSLKCDIKSPRILFQWHASIILWSELGEIFNSCVAHYFVFCAWRVFSRLFVLISATTGRLSASSLPCALCPTCRTRPFSTYFAPPSLLQRGIATE